VHRALVDFQTILTLTIVESQALHELNIPHDTGNAPHAQKHHFLKIYDKPNQLKLVCLIDHDPHKQLEQGLHGEERDHCDQRDDPPPEAAQLSPNGPIDGVVGVPEAGSEFEATAEEAAQVRFLVFQNRLVHLHAQLEEDLFLDVRPDGVDELVDHALHAAAHVGVFDPRFDLWGQLFQVVGDQLLDFVAYVGVDFVLCALHKFAVFDVVD
jgi:hypothetical protein